MANRKPYQSRSSVLSTWALKAIALVAIAATTVIVARTIITGVSIKSDGPQAGKYVGIRHEAAPIGETAGTRANVPTPSSDQDQEASKDTIVKDGITVVSPHLLVPVIDTASLKSADGSDDDANALNRSHDASRSHRQTRTAVASKWKAYGLTIR